MLYTRKGDDGTTKIFTSGKGERVSKNSCLIEALGSVDELNSFVGLCRAEIKDFKEIYNFNETQTKLTFSNLFRLALQTNIHGVVLSPLELGIVKNEEQQSGKKLIKVTPGIRFAHEINSNNIQDQQRIATPEDAVKNGADYLVMGRSITSGTPNFLK